MRIQYNRNHDVEQILGDILPGNVIPIYMGADRGDELFLITDFRNGTDGQVLCVNVETGKHEFMPTSIESPVYDCTVVVNNDPRK